MARGVLLPKGVHIENWQLWFLHKIFFVCALAAIVSQVMYFQTHRLPVEVNDIHGSVWVHSPNPADLSAEYQRLAGSELCQRANSFSFHYGDNVKAHTQGCTHTCLHGDASCVHPSIAFADEAVSQVMLSTRIAEETSSRNGSRLIHVDRFIPEVASQRVALSYSFTGPNEEKGSPMTNAQTHVRKGGEVIRKYSPGESITFSVHELLDLAGHPNALMQPNPWMAKNAIGYATGLELQLRVLCDELDAKMPTCMLDVAWKPRPWVFSNYVTELPDGSINHRTVYGLRISIMARATVRRMIPRCVFSTVIDALVLIMLPSQVIYFVSILFLGQLSKVYKKAAIERFVLSGSMAGLASRLFASNVVWLGLQGDDGYMSKDRMCEWITCIFEGMSHTIDYDKFNNLVDFCFSAILAGNKTDSLERMARDISKSVYGDEDDNQPLGALSHAASQVSNKISAADFCDAFGANESMNFHDIVALFDVERPTSILERLFEPESLKRYRIKNRPSKRRRKRGSSLKNPMNVDSKASGDSIFLELALSHIPSLEEQRAFMLEVASSSNCLKQQVAALENEVLTHRGLIQSKVKQCTDLREKIQDFNQRRINDIIGLMDKVHKLEALVDTKSAATTKSADSLWKVHSLITEDIKGLLEESKTIAPGTLLPGPGPCTHAQSLPISVTQLESGPANLRLDLRRVKKERTVP